MVFDWNTDKNEWLRKERDISFEQIVVAVESGDLLEVLAHPNQGRYGHQIVMLVKIEDYVYAVPTVVQKDVFFMKTAYPSRKYTAMYLP
ncbi:MAG TPA: DUF4258 domain-containing protein [Dissulfurispiraceae bacterium]|nr:DUF4258 domain-containing protein [Dissulfurispiraceae bacterium]